MKPSQVERLEFLARVALKEARLLEQTSGRLFETDSGPSPEQLSGWIKDADLAERLDAFVARFSRLQDTLGDKLIPALLAAAGERSGPVMDNLDRAERFGWIDSAEQWMTYRQLRNQMIHEYIEDLAVLANALEAGRGFVKPLLSMCERLVAEVGRRS